MYILPPACYVVWLEPPALQEELVKSPTDPILHNIVRGLRQTIFIFFSGILPLRGWVGRLKSAKKK